MIFKRCLKNLAAAQERFGGTIVCRSTQFKKHCIIGICMAQTQVIRQKCTEPKYNTRTTPELAM